MGSPRPAGPCSPVIQDASLGAGEWQGGCNLLGTSLCKLSVCTASGALSQSVEIGSS